MLCWGRWEQQVAIVLVTVHWGEEGTIWLRKYQPRLARLMIDNGADVVIGHHPHILQGIERYKRGIIWEFCLCP
jgi:poly-gamma-glutamate synthesis protein (capsule biosynthesis protein)